MQVLHRITQRRKNRITERDKECILQSQDLPTPAPVTSQSEGAQPTTAAEQTRIHNDQNQLPDPSLAQQPTTATKLNCTVCFDRLDAFNTPHRRVTTSCIHEPDICLPCLSQSISTQFTSKIWDQVSCPTCNERLHYHDIRAFADSVIFERYQAQACSS